MRSYLFLAAAAAVIAHPPHDVKDLQKRDAEECAKAYTAILPALTEVPTPDSTLASLLVMQTDDCVLPMVTGSLAEEYTSYASKFSSWYMDVYSGYTDLLNACSDVPAVTSELGELGTITCSEISWPSETGSSGSKASSSVSKTISSASETGSSAAETESSTSSDKEENKAEGNAASSASVKTGLVFAMSVIAGILAL
ncbi:hypothetical protein NW762_010955 [Fusarium torreyae]|uniref:Infection structure specific protein n=1 Tax=Fusarium torreyae TaxID=1237075 RepID=A0A9W8RRV2_9HYPO|nr:hypothetical protein NW762_010955 [Fusarium torreyae]